MLLESALLEFSTDDSEVFEDAVQHSGAGFDWETLGKSKFPSSNGGFGSGSNSDAAAGPAEIKHVYLDRKFPRSRPSGEFSAVRQSKPLSDFLGMSRSPPAVDVNCSPSFEITRADEDPVHEDGRSSGKEGPHSGSLKTTPIHGRSLKSGADSHILHENMSFTGEAGAVPSAWEAQPGKPKPQRGTSPNQQAKQQLQMPLTRAISMLKNGKCDSPSSASSQKKEFKNGREQQQQRGRPSSSPNARGVSPIRQSTTKVRSSSGDGKQIKRLDLFKSPEVHSRLENRRNRSDDADLFDNSMNSKYKYYEEESPVSILERPPSPPTTNSSGSSGSSVHSPPRPAAPAAAALPGGVALARRRPPSFSSPSAHESPRASTSSSTRYMGQCLVALQAALAIDPEKSKRFEDSFVELDAYVEGEASPSYAKSAIDDDDDDDDDLFNRNEQGRWARGAAVSRSDFEPEYNTMDFYTDSEEEIVDQESHISPSSSVASLARSSSGSSISRPIRRSLNYHRPMRVEAYSSKDKRFLSSHPSSWVDHGDDSISSSLTNSKCNTLTRHQEMPWDEQQQADLDAVRAEEVIRGAIDGLRFTYSPVSSAFVFSRSNEGDEEGVASGRKGYSPHNKTFTDSEASRRFSISLDYEASMRSEDSMSFARASDVTELGMSRAESWSKVARGAAFQQGYQDAIPSSFIRRAGHAPLFEDGNRSSNSQGFNPTGGIGEGTPDSRLVRKRLAKKSGMTTCLPFRAILRNFRTMGSPGRSRLGLAPCDGDRPAVNRLTY